MAAVALVLVVVLVGGGLAAWATLGSDGGSTDGRSRRDAAAAERDGRGSVVPR